MTPLTYNFASDNKYAHLLTPAAATSPTGSTEPPTYDALSSRELEVLVLELEQDIRAADRDLKEIDDLDSKGVTAAGKPQGTYLLNDGDRDH